MKTYIELLLLSDESTRGRAHWRRRVRHGLVLRVHLLLQHRAATPISSARPAILGALDTKERNQRNQREPDHPAHDAARNRARIAARLLRRGRRRRRRMPAARSRHAGHRRLRALDARRCRLGEVRLRERGLRVERARRGDVVEGPAGDGGARGDVLREDVDEDGRAGCAPARPGDDGRVLACAASAHHRVHDSAALTLICDGRGRTNVVLVWQERAHIIFWSSKAGAITFQRSIAFHKNYSTYDRHYMHLRDKQRQYTDSGLLCCTAKGVTKPLVNTTQTLQMQDKFNSR